jgi:hypothetical protein
VTCPVCSHTLAADAEAPYCAYCGALLAEPETAPLWVLDRPTNLFNRRFMEATLGQEMARSQRYDRALSFILVQLKEVPQERTQAILEDVRAALGRFVRDTDTLGHWGPDSARFAIILPETPPAGAATILNRLETVPLIAGHLICGLSGVLGASTSPLDLPVLAESDMLVRQR